MARPDAQKTHVVQCTKEALFRRSQALLADWTSGIVVSAHFGGSNGMLNEGNVQ